MSTQGYLALDLGAESGRAILATLNDGKLAMEELHRFRHELQHLPSGLHWNLTELWNQLLQGVGKGAKVAAERNIELVSLGCDTWGVDYALLGKSGQVLGLPFGYRDEKHYRAYEVVIANLGKSAIYHATGIQFMPLNTLYQIVAQKQHEPGLLDLAHRLVMIPDLFHYWFTGHIINEATDVSTTQMIDPRTGRWAKELLSRLDIPTHFLGETSPAGTIVGRLRREVGAQLGAANLGNVQVIAPGTHDTASAVAAVPVDVSKSPKWAYLSSGTWSLMGVEIDEPIITEAACQASITHERGVEGKIRFLKNIAGLWLVQECRREYDRLGTPHEYAELAKMAAGAEPFRTLVNPDFQPFALPGEMLEKLAGFAEITGQEKPETPSQFVRCCLESLAMAYRRTKLLLEKLIGWKIEVLHIVGGGGRNTLLNQLTADACGIPVIVGPHEATAIGNALVQAMGRGEVKNLAEVRQIVRNSFELETYEPTGKAKFDEQYPRYEKLLA
ncbi:MAG: rhamnulokinase family protein [Phycisphaeraceae bacterium]